MRFTESGTTLTKPPVETAPKIDPITSLYHEVLVLKFGSADEGKQHAKNGDITPQDVHSLIVFERNHVRTQAKMDALVDLELRLYALTDYPPRKEKIKPETLDENTEHPERVTPIYGAAPDLP